MRRLLLLLTIGLLALAGWPAAAGPPVHTTDAFPFTGPDFDHDLVIFVNTSREAFCTTEQVAFEQAVVDWLAGGMQTPFPDDPSPPPVGFTAFPVHLVDTPTGVIGNTRGPVEDLHLELWRFDAPEDRGGVGACLDTDDANELFGTGTSRFRGVVTDFFGTVFAGEVSRPSFVDHTQGGGRVTTPTGEQYDYTWFFHQHVPCGDGPGPRCEVARFSLRPLG